MGHGYGLPHSDESFTNADLGNCMDYTNNPEANMFPGEHNFNFLAKMYGTVDGSVPVQQPGEGGASAAEEFEQQQEGGIPEPSSVGGGRGNGGRVLRGRRVEGVFHDNGRYEQHEFPEEIPDWVVARWKELDEETDNHSHGAERRLGSGWRLLHESEHGESHEIDLGQGYRIQVHKLLAR